MMNNKEKNFLSGKYRPSAYTFTRDKGSNKTAFTSNGIVSPFGINIGAAGSTITTSS